MKTPTEYTYYAFISFNAKDIKWGKRLQRKLEHYRMPSTLCSERGWKRKPINPVFFAPTDIQPGPLTDELKERLRASRNLIVICSPNSAQSEWVGKEIEYFHELGRDSAIHFFIVDGTPNSGDPSTECFNPVVKKLKLPEILGANVHEKIFRLPRLNRERAYVQLISKLLGVEFDSIWKRHKRLLIAKTIAWIIGISGVLAAMIWIWAYNQPFDSKVRLEEINVHNSNLPPLQDAVITIYLDRETRTDTIVHEGDIASFVDIPHRYLGKDIRITFSCQDFIPLDTIVPLAKDVTLKISRDAAVYGKIRTELWDLHNEKSIANARVWIEDWETQSDAEGLVEMAIPLERQKVSYQIRIPDYNTNDTIAMPTNEYHSIVIQ